MSMRSLVRSGLIAGIAAMVYLGCEEDKKNPVAAVNQADLIGTWRLYQEIESWDYTEDGVRDNGSETYDYADSLFEIVEITDDSIFWYSDDGLSCYYVSGDAYTISGNQVLGDDFSGQETDSTGTYSWSTTVQISGNSVIVTERAEGSSQGMSGWEQESYYYSTYAGTIPPTGWPATECVTMKRLAAKLNKIHR